MLDQNVRHILKFLTHLYDVHKLAFNSINVARSAISSLLFHDSNLGENTLISRFMRGVYNLRPFIPKNTVIWDTKIVLDFLEKWHPAKNLSLRQLSIKTVLLCLLVSGQRGQTIWLMCRDNMKFLKNKVTCAIGDPTKTTNLKNHTQELVFKEYTNKALCVRHYLAQYKKRTEPLRSKEKEGGGSNSFFITTIPPHTPIKRGTLTSWVRIGLSLCGVDMDKFSPQSTRSASTSKVKSNVPLSTILKTAGWRRASTFARFYDKKLESEGWTMKDLDR